MALNEKEIKEKIEFLTIFGLEDNIIPSNLTNVTYKLNRDIAGSDLTNIQDKTISISELLGWGYNGSIGSTHIKYAGKSWINIFNDLSKTISTKIVLENFKNGGDFKSYIEGLNNAQKNGVEGGAITVGKIGGERFVTSGNSRVANLMVALNLAKNKLSPKEVQELGDMEINISEGELSSDLYAIFGNRTNRTPSIILDKIKSEGYVIEENDKLTTMQDAYDKYLTEKNIAMDIELSEKDLMSTNIDTKMRKFIQQYYEKDQDLEIYSLKPEILDKFDIKTLTYAEKIKAEKKAAEIKAEKTENTKNKVQKSKSFFKNLREKTEYDSSIQMKISKYKNMSEDKEYEKDCFEELETTEKKYEELLEKIGLDSNLDLDAVNSTVTELDGIIGDVIEITDLNSENGVEEFKNIFVKEARRAANNNEINRLNNDNDRIENKSFFKKALDKFTGRAKIDKLHQEKNNAEITMLKEENNAGIFDGFDENGNPRKAGIQYSLAKLLLSVDENNPDSVKEYETIKNNVKNNGFVIDDQTIEQNVRIIESNKNKYLIDLNSRKVSKKDKDLLEIGYIQKKKESFENETSKISSNKDNQFSEELKVRNRPKILDKLREVSNKLRELTEKDIVSENGKSERPATEYENEK